MQNLTEFIHKGISKYSTRILRIDNILSTEVHNMNGFTVKTLVNEKIRCQEKIKHYKEILTE